MAGGNTVTLTFAGDDRSLGRTLAGLAAKLNTTQRAAQHFRVAGIAALATAAPYAVGALTGLSGAIAVLPSMAFAGALGLGALALGAGGFIDALKNMGDGEAFVASIAKLSPAAREAAIAVGMMKPEFDKLKTALEQTLFTGLADNIHRLSANLLPVLHTQLVSTAESINATAKEFTGWLSAPKTVGDINTALDGSRGFLDGLMASLKPVSAAFLDIGVVAAPHMKSMGDSIARAAEKFEEFVGKARESGQLGEWIQKGLDTFSALWGVLKTVGEAIWNIGAAFGESGFPSALQLIADGLLKMSEFIRENSAIMVPLITSIGLFIATAKLIAGLVAIFNTVKTAILGIRAAMLLFNLAMFASPITWIVLGIMALIAAIVLCIVYWDEIKAAAVAAWEWIKVKWGEAVEWLKAVWNLIRANALAAWNAVKAYIVGKVNEAVDWVMSKWNAAVGWLKAVWDLIKSNAIAVWNTIKDWIARKVAELMAKVEEIKQLPGKVREYFNRMKEWAIQKAVELVNWVRGLPGRIKSALGNLGTLLVSAGRDLLNGLWNGISAGWSWLTGKVSEVASSLLATAKSALGISSPSKEFRDNVGNYIPEGLAQGILNNAGVAIDAARLVGTAAAEAARQAAMAVPTGMMDAMRAISNRIRSGGHIFEDLTWTGMPKVVAQYNDQVMDMLFRGGVKGDTWTLPNITRGIDDYMRNAPQRGSSYTPALDALTRGGFGGRPSTNVTVNVGGSIRSDRDLIAIIRDEMDRGGFRGVR